MLRLFSLYFPLDIVELVSYTVDSAEGQSREPEPLRAHDLQFPNNFFYPKLIHSVNHTTLYEK